MSIFFKTQISSRTLQVSFPSSRNKYQYFSVIRIFLKHPYYASFEYISHLHNETQSNVYEDAAMKLKFVNEKFGNMEKETWYLLPEAYTIQLIPVSDLLC